MLKLTDIVLKESAWSEKALWVVMRSSLDLKSASGRHFAIVDALKVYK